MGLHGVLSAMREIILDLDPIPATFEERQALYKDKFPSLTDNELEDLAKIEAKRFSTYTTSIFSGEKGILENHFPLTLSFLKNHWIAIYGKDFIEFEFAKALHKARPWKSYTTEFLLNCFLDYLEKDLGKFHELLPEVLDLASLEYSTFVIKRHVDDVVHPRDNISIEALKLLTVDDLLGKKGFIPSCVQMKKFPHDVVKIFVAVNHDREDLPVRIPSAEIFAIGARNGSNFVRWTKVPQEVYKFLIDTGAGRFFELFSLAEVVISSSPASEGEEAIFMKFLELLVSLMNCGIVCVR